MALFRPSRRSFGALATLAAVSVALPALRAQTRLEKSRVTIAIGGKSALYYLPLAIADALGYFSAEGLGVELIDFAGGARAAQAVQGGVADVGAGAFERMLSMQGATPLLGAFVLMGRAPQMALGVSALKLPDIKTVADLKGHTIGVSAPGASTHMLASLVLARAGVKAADVSFVGVGVGEEALSALRLGQVDALCNPDPVMGMLERWEVRIMADTRTLKNSHELFGGPMPAACLYAPQGFVQKNPQTVQAMASAIVRALKWLQTAGPGDIIKTVPEAYMLGERALYLAAFNKVRETFSLDGMVSEDAARTAWRALTTMDTPFKPERAERMAPSIVYTNEFAQRAKARYKV